ncbi:PREDICTED: MICAL C-terminal-like protein [Ceratotherium simum simum]|uniref:MICAL C-terminal-like protein n=1 Tax=Ceratotherium simum simum TaxID=73337 RepID=A0ABM1CRE6_CERSS|nr:PREDICTED: MICAL C-terminal-like protein [Ceratotherium simum simum]
MALGLRLPVLHIQSTADEPTSPKKPKSVPEPEPGDVEGGPTSPLPSEWTSVRISPGENVVGQDMMAVCVLVTSDESSSDAESDYGGSEASSVEPCGERPWWLEPPPLPKPLTRHSSLKEALTGAFSPQGPEEHRAVHAFQVTAHNRLSQVSRDHFNPSTPIFLRRARAPGALKEIPLYLPRGQVLERAEYCLVSPSGDGLPSTPPPSPAERASDGCQEAEAPLGDTRSIHRGPHPIRGKDRCLPDQELPPRAGEDPGEGSTRPRRGEEHGSEPAEGKKLGLKKLVLSQEQKTRLLDWNDSIPEGLRLEVGTRLSQKTAENGRGSRVLKPVHPLLPPRAVRETLPAHREPQEKMGTPAEWTPRERSVSPPKSPLRLIANAIRRSLGPLLPNSEGGKKAWAKPESKTLPTSQPHASARSFSLQKTSSSKDWDQQSPKRDMSSDPSPPDPALRTRSLPNRPSKMFPELASPPCSKMEDVPTLLEKVSLEETFPDSSSVPKRKTSLFSSFRLKDKSFESFLQESRQRKDLRNVFSSPQGRVLPVDNAQPLEKLVQPFSSTGLGQRVHPPPEGVASPKHGPMRRQVTGAASSPSSTTSSSTDEEFDPQSSLWSKERKTLRRRRKLEKATKQLVKQEELKRLHKAQAIQRQLEEVEERQRASEIQGVRLEKALRGEADSDTQDEAQLLQEWFKLVLEKNKLMRYESELLIMAQELELEDHQSRLEQKLREKMLKEESQKNENDLNEEQKIFTEMMQVIEQRDKLVDSLEEQRIKEKAEDQHFESFIFSQGCQLSRT